jgi:hypothetical protein
MRLIDRIALNRLISIIASLIISLAKIFEKHMPNKIEPSSPAGPKRPRPLKRIIDIIPYPWKK